jgi:hypothetical protein
MAEVVQNTPPIAESQQGDAAAFDLPDHLDAADAQEAAKNLWEQEAENQQASLQAYNAEAHKTAIQLSAFTTNKSQKEWTRVPRCYLLIAGIPISTPCKYRLKKNLGPSSETLDVSVSAHDSNEDYSSLHVKLFARDLGLVDEKVGELVVQVKDLKDIKYAELDHTSPVLETICLRH